MGEERKAWHLLLPGTREIIEDRATGNTKDWWQRYICIVENKKRIWEDILDRKGGIGDKWNPRSYAERNGRRDRQ